MENIKYNLYQKPILNQKEASSKLYFINKGSSLDKENQILFNSKSSLEVLLYMIKNFQSEYLLKPNNKKQIIKEILISLKDNLNLMLQEKNKKFNYIKKQNEKSKNNLHKILFPSSKDLKKNEYNLKLNYKYYNNKTNSIVFEKKELGLLNFQIKNEIKKTNSLIEQKMQIISFLKEYPFFSETIQKIFCNNKYDDINKVSDILKEIIKNVRKDFINIVKEKMAKDSEINDISFQIENIKDFIEDYKLKGCKKYIETKDIIQENSKEFSETTVITSHSKRNSFLAKDNNRIEDKNNIDCIYLKNKNNINHQKERKIKDISQKYYSLNKKITKDLFGDKNNNKINNYLNMNINVNININNNNYIQKFYLDRNKRDKNNEENEQYEMELNEKNKIIMTPIITYENKNTLNHRNSNISIESSINDENFSFSNNVQ